MNVPTDPYQNMFESFPSGLLLLKFDETGDLSSCRQLKVNEAACRITGMEMKSNNGKLWGVAYPEFAQSELTDIILEVVSTGETKEWEIEMGDSGQQGKGMGGSVWLVAKQVVGVTFKPTTVLKLRRELKEKERRLEKMGQMSRIGYWEIDLENDIVIWSDITKQIFEVDDDYTPDLETAYSFYKSGEDREKIERVVEKAIKHGESYDVELRIITANGKELWTRSIGEPLMNEDGECIRMNGSIQDIDQRKRIQIESERSRLLLETITNNTESAIWVRDSEGRHIFVNQKWKDIFELRDQEIIGKTAFDLLDEATARAFQKNDNKVLNSNQSIKYEERVPTVEGDRYYLTNMFPMGKVPGVGKAVGGLATDITERNANERKIKKSLKEKEFLLAEVHHRVKNNLAIISSLITLQIQNVEDEYFRNILEDSSNRIHSIAMVHELLYQSENFAEIPFEDYIKDLLTTIKKTMDIDGNNIDLVTKVEVGGLNINQAIPLGLMFNELVTNSLKYAFINRRKGKIIVSITRSGNNIKVLYEDTGKGYPDDIDFTDTSSLGHTLIHTLLKQLQGDYKVETKGKFRLEFKFEEIKSGSHSNL